MQEVAFLRQNADKWKQFESHLSGKEKLDPDVMADYFIQLTDDLSYSKTYFPGSNTTRYLNTLTAQAHQAIYRNKKESRSRFFSYWKIELPLNIRSSYRELFYAFAIFILAVLIGIVSTLNDDTFVRLILGDAYVNMTLENIKNNDPMAVYKQMNEVNMFLGITLNNIRVAFFAFAAGILLSFGTAWVLFYNGVMLGAFHTFFYQNDLLTTALLTIWIHGTLEISAIIIAGAAGLVIGNSLLFPGTYTRRRSFILGSRKGLKIVIGLVPIFMIAGFLEGFVTRHTDMPTWLSSGIIVVSFIFVVAYFIIYPFRINIGKGDGERTKNNSAPIALVQ